MSAATASVGVPVVVAIIEEIKSRHFIETIMRSVLLTCATIIPIF